MTPLLRVATFPKEVGVLRKSNGLPVLAGSYDVVLDAIFGFGFKGDPRPPFDTILKELSRGITPVVSVDVPSGWSVGGQGAR